jgi:hypothetical protein
MLDIAACPGDEVVQVAAQSRGDVSPGGAYSAKAEAQRTYDFALTMAGRADDMVLRVKSVDELIDWVNAIAAARRLVYDPVTGSWSAQAEPLNFVQAVGTNSGGGALATTGSTALVPGVSAPAAPSSPIASTSPKAAFNPKARMKNRMQQSTSVDQTSSSPPKQTPPPQDNNAVFNPFHAGAATGAATGSHAPDSLHAGTVSSASGDNNLKATADRMSEQPVRASESSLGVDSADSQEKFSLAISSSRDLEHDKYDDGRVVEVRSSWCCWR